jgi:hypothetical protein
MIFGMKTKKLARFGKKMTKAGVFGLKNGGKMAAYAGTMMGQPNLMAAGAAASALGEGLEKM